MKIKIVTHARERAAERGASEKEIRQTVAEGKPVLAKKGRTAKEMIFGFKSKWLGREYAQKKVQAIFIEEKDGIMVITVKVFYGEWR